MPVKKEQPDSSQGEPINGGRPASTSVAGMLLSYSHILRVIGQELEPLGVDAFELVKLGDDFSVSMNQLELKQYPSAQPTILDKFIHKIFGRSDCLIETPHHKYFAKREILVADIERQSRRRG